MFVSKQNMLRLFKIVQLSNAIILGRLEANPVKESFSSSLNLLRTFFRIFLLGFVCFVWFDISQVRMSSVTHHALCHRRESVSFCLLSSLYKIKNFNSMCLIIFLVQRLRIFKEVEEI